MSLNDAVPSSATDVFKRNAEDADRLLNAGGTVTNRLGNQLLSWEQISQSHAAWNNRGAWITATAYAVNDIWEDGGVWYVVLSAYTSGASAAADIAGPNVVVLSGNFVQGMAGLGFDEFASNKNIVYPVNSIQNLAGLVGVLDDQQISLKGWHPDSDYGGGILYWDAAKLKSEHNGGTVFSPTVPYSATTGDYLDGVGETDGGGSGCWVRLAKSEIHITDFGASIWPFISTSSIQAALNYVLSLNTMNPGSDGSGKPTLVIDRGLFETSSLSIASAIGLKIIGAGQQSSTLVFTDTLSTFLSVTTYIGLYIEDITLAAGSVSAGAGGPVITRQATPDNTCIGFDGTNGGTNYVERNVKHIGWETVYDTKTSTVNEDGHSYHNCRYLYNTNIWDNTNTQAVIWAFTECQIFYTLGNVFNNPGSKLSIYGGDYINGGTFINGGNANTTTDILLKGLRFENYQNIEPSSSPKFLDLSGTHKIQFEQCSAIGGGSLAGKDSFLLSGYYDLVFDDCSFDGNMAATVASSQNGITPKVTFERCREVPIVVQTLSAGQSFAPLNIVYTDMPISGGVVNRRFAGALPTQSQPVTPPTNSDQVRFESVLNASSAPKSIPILVLPNYKFIVTQVKVLWWNNTANTVNIKVWKDNAKTVQIADITTAAASSTFQLLEASGTGIMNTPVIDDSSLDLYVEFIAAGNAGTCRAMIEIETSQVF